MNSDRLHDWVRDDFGVELSSVERIHHGADTAAEVWRGITPTMRQYAVKWSGGGSDAGPLVTAHLVEQRVPGIVGPARTVNGELWSMREGRRLSLQPWITASRALHARMTSQQWTAYGELLARVHATEPTAVLAAVLRREDDSQDRMVALIRTIEHRLSTETPGDRLEGELALAWKGGRNLIDWLIEVAADVKQRLRTDDAPAVICHADPHLGNVLVGPGDEVWLIDWDDAVLAPREQDLMFMLGGMGEFGPVSEQERTWFFNGYGHATMDPTRLTYYRCTRALEEAALWAEQSLTGPDREDALAIFRTVVSPAGMVAVALSPQAAAQPP